MGTLCFVGCGSLGGGGDPADGVDTTVRAVETLAWLGPISDEANKKRGDCRTLTGDASMIAMAAGCHGSYCDDMYLECLTAPAGIYPSTTAPLSATPFVSDENGSPAAKCPAGSVIDGLQATGSYSDNVSALCLPTTINDSVWAPMGVVCNWTWWLSDEIGQRNWPYARTWDFGWNGYGIGYATALRCSGSYCDNISYYGCGLVEYYPYYEFSTQDDRGYTGEGDWSPGDPKGECESAASAAYMTGISANGVAISNQLRPHRALCVWGSNRLDVDIFGLTNWNSRLHSHSVATGDDRGDTGTGDWDQGFWKAECARTEVMVGVSQTPSHSVSRILCAPMNQVRSNVSSCRALTYSNVSDNRLNALSSDWDPGYSKNECGLNQVLKGISRNPTTGEIHRLLCCDQQPDAL